MVGKCGEKSWVVTIVLSAGILSYCSPTSSAADFITGVVRNQTQGRPASGDEVILLSVDQDTREEARAKTDSQGAFTIELHEPGNAHLIRVIHQGVNYDQRVSGANAISIDIADAADDVQAISGGIEIIRAGTQGNLLHVSELVEIKNDSNPPMTEASERTFEVYLPGDAKIESVLAAGPENIGERISATPVRGEPGHYTVNFPLRPGSTKFAFNYDLPYDGRTTFRTKNMYSLKQLAVMMPPTMTFASRSASFQILPVGNSGYRVEAIGHLEAGDGPEFEISGVGALPSMQAPTHSPPRSRAGFFAVPSVSVPGNENTRAQSAKVLGSVPFAQSSALSSRMQWRDLSAAAVVIVAIYVILVWRRQHPLTSTVTMAVRGTVQAERTQASLVEALKDGLFQLETDWMQGSILEDEYASAKQALECTIQWALTRATTRRNTAREELSSDVPHPSRF